MMVNAMKKFLLDLLLLVAFLCGCVGSPGSVKPQDSLANPDPVPQTQGSGAITVQPLHNTSGAPMGIRLSWFAVQDATDGGSRIAGYHVYKSIDPIPDSAKGDNSFWLELGGETQFDQPMMPGSEIVLEDFFAVNVGESWHYRLSSVANDGDESALSPEETVTIAPFIVDLLLTTSAGVGDAVQIQGRNFGVFDAANDQVEVPGVIWQNGVGFSPAMLEAVITDWQPGLISIEVPPGATIGKIQVTVAGFALDTAEDFENSDPYLTDVDRLDATFQDPITLTGKNFGAARDIAHRVVYAGTELLQDNNYTAYSDTAITFIPPNLQSYSLKEVTVRVDAVDSNSAFNLHTNAPPLATLSAMPVSGVVPLTLRFDASTSLDPENDSNPNNGITTYHWDFDGDGLFNETTNGESAARGSSRPLSVYNTVGVFNAAVRVFDVELGMDSATITIDVTNPPPPTIFDDGAQPDPDEPGQVDNSTAPDYVVNLFYGIQDGSFPLTVEVDADYVEVVPGDPVASFGQNDPAQVFQTDNSPFAGDNPNIADTVTVTQPVPGNYFIALRITDAIGRQAVLVYPSAVKYSLPSNVAVILDDEGDPSRVASDAIFAWLNNLGYQTQILNSAGLILGDLDGFDACIWASDGPRGIPTNPFQWLSLTDLALIRAFEDTGRSVIILSPAGGDTGADMFQDGTFNNTYQPFQGARVIDAAAGEDLFPLDFTATGPPDINSIQYQGIFADTNQTPLYAGTTMEMEWADPGGGQLEPVAAIRPGPVGGNLYFAMFSVTGIVGLDPPELGPEVLLDYIVSGTIALQ